MNFTMLFQHAWSLFGNEENYNKARGVIIGGIGGTYASGFLGALIRGHMSGDWPNIGLSTTFLGYRPQGTLVISGSQTAPLSGVEGGIGVGFLF